MLVATIYWQTLRESAPDPAQLQDRTTVVSWAGSLSVVFKQKED